MVWWAGEITARRRWGKGEGRKEGLEGQGEVEHAKCCVIM